MDSTPHPSSDERIQQLQDEQRRLVQRIDDFEARPKDIWDKLGSLTGVLVALIGAVFTAFYNHHQSEQDAATRASQAELQRIETVGKFMPYLIGNDNAAKSIALSEVKDVISAQAAISIALSVNAARQPGKPDPVVVSFLKRLMQSGKPEDREAAAQGIKGICGSERVLVKTLNDPDAAKPFAQPPTVETLENLIALQRPSTLPDDHRSGSEEQRMYTITVEIVRLKQEFDGDYHLELKGPSGATMIAEIISPDCYLGNDSNVQTELQNVRDAAQRDLLGQSFVSSKKAEITGVAFFDLMHGQTGMAPNGLELHPVLSLKILP